MEFKYFEDGRKALFCYRRHLRHENNRKAVSWLKKKGYEIIVRD